MKLTTKCDYTEGKGLKHRTQVLMYASYIFQLREIEREKDRMPGILLIVYVYLMQHDILSACVRLSIVTQSSFSNLNVAEKKKKIPINLP